MEATRVRRLISRLMGSKPLVVRKRTRCAGGKLKTVNPSCSLASAQSASLGASIGLACGQINPYSCVGNDPVNNTDPSGMIAAPSAKVFNPNVIEQQKTYVDPFGGGGTINAGAQNLESLRESGEQDSGNSYKLDAQFRGFNPTNPAAVGGFGADGMTCATHSHFAPG